MLTGSPPTINPPTRGTSRFRRRNDRLCRRRGRHRFPILQPSPQLLHRPLQLLNPSFSSVSSSLRLRPWGGWVGGWVTLDLVSVSQVHRVLVGRQSYELRGFRGDGLPSVIDFDVGI